MQSNQRRNRQLTYAFALSCFLWILTWTPAVIMQIIYDAQDDNTTGVWLKSNQNNLFYLDRSHDFLLLYSLINPLIFIFVSKDFQEPLKEVGKKLVWLWC